MSGWKRRDCYNSEYRFRQSSRTPIVLLWEIFIVGLLLVSVSSDPLHATDLGHFPEKITDELITTSRGWTHRTLDIVWGLLGLHSKLDLIEFLISGKLPNPSSISHNELKYIYIYIYIFEEINVIYSLLSFPKISQRRSPLPFSLLAYCLGLYTCENNMVVVIEGDT